MICFGKAERRRPLITVWVFRRAPKASFPSSIRIKARERIADHFSFCTSRM